MCVCVFSIINMQMNLHVDMWGNAALIPCYLCFNPTVLGPLHKTTPMPRSWVWLLGSIYAGKMFTLGAVMALMDSVALVTRGWGFESQLRQELSTTEVRPLSKAPNPRLLSGRCSVGCPLLQVCALGWVKCRAHISMLVILCIIVYVTNKAHLSLIIWMQCSCFG